MIKSAFLLALAAAPVSASVSAPVSAVSEPGQHHSDQKRAFEARREGRVLPVREIERRVVPTMPGARYLGFDFDDGGAVYTLKFLRDGRVIWVEVDGRTGHVLGRTGR